MKTKLALLFLLFSIESIAQRDSVSVDRGNLLTKFLKPSKSTYLVTSANAKTGAVTQISVWNRETRFEKKGGRDVVVVKQMRYYADTVNNKFVYTISDRGNLRTIYDYTKRLRSGIEAFNYLPGRIVGADTVDHNAKAGFAVGVRDFPFCFEMDLETLALLPIKKVGQALAINFYHPGGETPPQYYPVEVLSEEDFLGPNGVKIKCWKIKLQYDSESFDYSWISKEGHELLKLEGHYPGIIFTKLKTITPFQ